MEKNLIAAQTMAQAVQFDPQLTVPQYPRFPTELTVVPLEDGILIAGTDEFQILRGRATRVFLPRLLPLLDGTRTVQQIHDTLSGVSSQAITNAIALLYTRGVLEDAAADPVLESPPVNEQTLSFFRHYVDVTRFNRSALQAYARLQDYQLVIATQGPGAEKKGELLAMLLNEAGLYNVVLRSNEKISSSSIGPKAFVIAFLEPEENRQWMQELDDICAEQHRPWLRAAWYAAEQVLELGPYFERDETSCYRCFVQMKSAQNTQSIPLPQQSNDLQLLQALSLLAIEVVYLLSRIVPAATGSGVTQYHLSNWTTSRLYFPKVPGCPFCRPVDHSMSSNLATDIFPDQVVHALLYEDAVAFPSRHLLDPKSHQIHYRSDNIELTFQSKKYFNAIHVSLPPVETLLQFLDKETPDSPRGVPALNPSRGHCDLTTLATMLLISAGIHGQAFDSQKRVKRWSSTGGNLGSVELYVVILHIDGCKPGIYFYQPFEHYLASVAHFNNLEPILQFLNSAFLLKTEPEAVIIATTAFHRVSHKYGAFGYRICYLDAGFAVAQMQMIGEKAGLYTRSVPEWADDLVAEQLRLEDIDEMITAVIALGETEMTMGDEESETYYHD